MRHIGRLKSPEYWMQNNAVQCFTAIRVVHFFVRGPCTTLWHTERLRRNTPRCGDEKRKQSRISLIYRIVCLPLRRSAAQKRRPLRPPRSGKRDSDPRPQPWQGCALKPPKRYAFRGNQLIYFLLRRFSRMCFTMFFALVKRMVKHLRLSTGL